MADFIRRPLAMLSPPAIVAIVVIVFLYAGYREWLKAGSDRDLEGTYKELTATLQSLEERLAQVEQERDALVERIQNLETIVTSEAWIAQHDGDIDSPALNSESEEDLTLPTDSDSDIVSASEQTAELARRLRSNEATNGDL